MQWRELLDGRGAVKGETYGAIVRLDDDFVVTEKFTVCAEGFTEI